MKILVLSDIHGDISLVSNIQHDMADADWVFLSGDITHFGKTSQIHKIIETIKLINHNIMAIPGNCDYTEVNQYLVKNGYSIDCKYRIYNNIFIMGIGGSLPCPGRTPNEYSEEEFSTMLEETISENNNDRYPVILLVHQPPFNTLADKLSDGFHIGSHSVRHFIEKYQPLICFSGHIHEGTGNDMIGKSVIVNPGPFKMGKYTRAIIKKGIVDAKIIDMFADKTDW